MSRHRGPTRSAITAVALSALFAGAAPLVVATAAPPAASAAAKADQEPLSVTAARAQAKATGRPVPVNAMTTSTQSAVANPDGSITETISAGPVRTKVDGAWTALNPTLHHDRSGRLSPKVSAAAVELSDGGSTPLATLAGDYGSLTISWPGPLPTPTVSGSTATYSSVLPGVDLQATIDAQGGLSDTLIIENAAAASDPGLAQITYNTATDGLTLAQTSTGDITATAAGGQLQYIAPAPIMWDSATNPSVPNPSPSSPSGPGTGANTAFVPTTLSGSNIVLTPSQTMLSSPSTVYPVYLDPDWAYTTLTAAHFDQVKSGWNTYGYDPNPCSDTSEYDSLAGINDSGQLGVGLNGWSGCQGIDRAYYQFNLPSTIWGTDIGNATMKAYEIYSASCSVGPSTVSVWGSHGGITSSTDWDNQPGNPFSSALASTTVGTACGSSPAISYNLTSYVANDAAAHATIFTVVLRGDEGNDVNFKRFCAPSAPSPCASSENPTLVIKYDTIPTTPASGELTLGNYTTGTTIACDTNSSDPNLPIVGNTNIDLSAVVNKSGGGALTNYFDIVNTANQTVKTITITANSGTRAATGPIAPLSSTDGAEFGWYAYSSDGIVTGPQTTKCWFKVDASSPKYGPTITSSAFPDDEQVSGGTTAAVTGTTGQVTLCPGAGSTLIASYTWWINGAQANAYPTNAASSNGCITITITATQAREYSISAYDRDAGANQSPPSVYNFPVKPATLAPETAGDLNGDGRPDLVTTNNTDNLYLLAGTGDGKGGLAAGLPLAEGGWKGSLTAVHGDFINQDPQNGPGTDGYQDIVAYLPNDNSCSNATTSGPCLWIYPGNGYGGIDINQGLAVADPDTGGPWPTNITQIVVGDFTGQTDFYDNPIPDVIVVTPTAATVYQWDPNTQTLSNVAQLDPAVNWSTLTLVNPGHLAADTTCATCDDLWARDSSGNLNQYLAGTLNYPAGTVAAETDNPTTVIATGVTPSQYPNLYTSGNLDGDGLPDLWATNSAGNYVFFDGTSSGGLVAPANLTLAAAPLGACPATLPVTDAHVSSALAGWPATNAYDNNPGSDWSSNGHSTANATEWIAYWWPGFVNINYISLWPRAGGQGFPINFNIYYSKDTNGSLSWAYAPGAASFTNYPKPTGTSPVIITFANPVNTNGLYVPATVLGADSYGNHYYQIAEVNAACTLDT